MENSNIVLSNKTESSVAQESSITDTYSAPEARFECPICLAWLRDPVLTSCGHRFCRSCIHSWLERENACPVDNMKLRRESDIFPDNFTRREISQQRTKCPNIVRGCLEELSPLDVEAHLIVCKFKPPELPENEKLRCSFVTVGCTEKFEDEPELQRHLEQFIAQHLTMLSEAYTKLTINSQANASSSAIAQQANFWDPPAKNPSDNIASSDNVQALLKDMYEKVIILEQKTREQDIIIANMSAQISSLNTSLTKLPLRYCNGCYLWSFTDFKNKINTMKENPRIMHYSPGFYTSPYGYKLCLRLNLSPKNPNFIALLVHIMKTEHDQALAWPFSGRLSITLVHPTENHRNIKETMISHPQLEAFKQPVQDFNTKGFGYTEFALVEDIISQGFISNNQLLIKIQAQPV